MPGRHILSILDLQPEVLRRLIDRSVQFAAGNQGEKPLAGKIVGLYFKKPSTRTRTSFTAGALLLGAQTVTFGPTDLQLATGETLEDTGRVLAGYLDALVVRTNETVSQMRALACEDEMPVINAMSTEEHPTQAIADLSTLKEHFGSLDQRHLLYVGEGNNSAAALALSIAQIPTMKVTLVTPEGYGLSSQVQEQAGKLARQHGAEVVHHHDVAGLPEGVDAVYATRWQTMGETKATSDWKERFRPYCVTEELMARVSKPGTIFMHDLPAVRGEDVVDEVLDGPQSVAWRQARHKMFSAMAVLEWTILGTSP